MFKLVAVYKVPENKDAFESHYKEVHMPLTVKIPRIKEVRMNRVFGGPMGKSELHLITELCFVSKEDFKAAMSTPEAMASGKDAMSFAKNLVSVHFAEETVQKL